MDDKTKKAALDKVESISEFIAYPNELLDNKKVEEIYDKLQITPGNFLENCLNLTRYNDDYVLSQLNKPVNKSDWITHRGPTAVNAYYSFNENSIRAYQSYVFKTKSIKFLNFWSIKYVVEQSFQLESYKAYFLMMRTHSTSIMVRLVSSWATRLLMDSTTKAGNLIKMVTSLIGGKPVPNKNI